MSARWSRSEGKKKKNTGGAGGPRRRAPVPPPRPPRPPSHRPRRRPPAPGGRWIVTWLTFTRWAHRILSIGCASTGPAIQVVAGLPSKADLGRSSGQEGDTDDAVT